MILLIKNPAYNSRFLAGRFLESFESPDVQYRREPQNIPSCRKWLRMLCGAQPISTVERRYSLLIRHSGFSVVIYPADSSGFWCKLRMRFGWMAIKAGMTAGITAPDLFKGRHYDREIIVLCVRGYLRFKLSSRDLVQMIAERGFALTHTAVLP